MKTQLCPRCAACLVGVLGILSAATPACASNATYGGAKPLSSTVDASQLADWTGESVRFTTTFHNAGNATPELVAFLSILDARTGVPQDLRDWSGNRSQDVPALPSARNTTMQAYSSNWTLRTPLAGDFVVYVIAIERNGDPNHVRVQPFSTPPIHLHVALHANPNPGGILPVIVGAPAVLAALLLQRKIPRGDKHNSTRPPR